MSTDRPINREQHQDHHHDCNDTGDREQRYFGDVARLNGHELVAIDEWLPGVEPTPYKINLTDDCDTVCGTGAAGTAARSEIIVASSSPTVRHQSTDSA